MSNMKNKNRKMIISEQTYREIFNTIYSVLAGNIKYMNHACLYFSMLGFAIMRKKYGIAARPVAGMAFYQFSDNEKCNIAFANIGYDKATSSESGFHCWLECDGMLLDFMAPIFDKVMLEGGHPHPCLPSIIIQRSMSTMKSDQLDINSSGDFYLPTRKQSANTNPNK